MPRLAKLGVLAVAFVFLAGFTLPGCPWFKMMKYQQARDGFSYDTDDYDAPGPKVPSMRLPVAGTVPIDGGDLPVTLLDADDFIRNPRPGESASIERGRVRFATFCVPCHGADGQGKGLVGQKFPIVLSLITDQAKGYSDQYLFTMIRNGRGLMPSYGDRVMIDERWDIVNYIRELQGAPHRIKSLPPPGVQPAPQPGQQAGAQPGQQAAPQPAPGKTASQ